MSSKNLNGMVRARVEPVLKNNVERILESIGLNASDAIRMYYKQIELQNGIPFEVKIPNATTLEAMRDAETKTNVTSFDSAEDSLRSLGL